MWFSAQYWPGGGGGGRVGVPVLGGRAGGTSDWVSSWKRFLLLMPNWSEPFDWMGGLTTNYVEIMVKLNKTKQKLTGHGITWLLLSHSCCEHWQIFNHNIILDCAQFLSINLYIQITSVTLPMWIIRIHKSGTLAKALKSAKPPPNDSLPNTAANGSETDNINCC